VSGGTAYVTFVSATTGNVEQNINTALTYNPNSGNLTAYGLITTTGLYWANGSPFVSSSYGNTEVAAYLPINSTITGIQANVGAYQSYANANIGSIRTNLNTLDANVGAYEIYANANIGSIRTNLNTLDANVGAYQTYANANIGTLFNGNISTNANLGAYQTYANANAATQTTSINTVNANIGAYQTWANTSIVSLYTNANANTAAYLTTQTGNIQAGNISVTGNVNVTSNVFANKLYTTNGLYWAGNGVAFSSGGGAGLTYTAGVAPPVSGNISGDQWYYTSTDVLYEYVNDGTTSYWVDIQSQTIAATTTPPVDTTDILSPFLLAGM
jgi:hypothetical protein